MLHACGDRSHEHRLDLQLVCIEALVGLLPALVIDRKGAPLLRQRQALSHALRGDEVDRGLDARTQVAHLRQQTNMHQLACVSVDASDDHGMVR